MFNAENIREIEKNMKENKFLYLFETKSLNQNLNLPQYGWG